MTPLTAPLTAPPWWHWIRLYATHRWPTKAMTGNARRRELMAQVETRTVRTNAEVHMHPAQRAALMDTDRYTSWRGR